MFTVENSVHIKRSPEDVWSYLSDPQNQPEWNSQTIKAEWASHGTPGVGSIWRNTTKFMGREVASEMEMTEWQPGKKNSYKSVGGPFPMHGSNTLEAKDNGTQVNMTIHIQAEGFLKLAEGVVGKQMGKQQEADLNALKLILESA